MFVFTFHSDAVYRTLENKVLEFTVVYLHTIKQRKLYVTHTHTVTLQENMRLPLFLVLTGRLRELIQTSVNTLQWKINAA